MLLPPILPVGNFWRRSVSLLRKFQWNQIPIMHNSNITIIFLNWLFLLHDITVPHFCILESSKLTAQTYISASVFKDKKIKTVPFPLSSPIMHCSSFMGFPQPTRQPNLDCKRNTENYNPLICWSLPIPGAQTAQGQGPCDALGIPSVQWKREMEAGRPCTKLW